MLADPWEILCDLRWLNRIVSDPGGFSGCWRCRKEFKDVENANGWSQLPLRSTWDRSYFPSRFFFWGGGCAWRWICKDKVWHHHSTKILLIVEPGLLHFCHHGYGHGLCPPAHGHWVAVLQYWLWNESRNQNVLTMWGIPSIRKYLSRIEAGYGLDLTLVFNIKGYTPENFDLWPNLNIYLNERKGTKSWGKNESHHHSSNRKHKMP